MGVTAGTVGTVLGFSGTTATAVGAGTLAVGSAAAGAGFAALLAPKAPRVPGVTPMPDQQAINQQQQILAAQTMFRTGRAATVLSSNQNTGDRLGP